MRNSNGRKIKVIGIVFGIVITIAGIIWAASAQNQKLEATSKAAAENTKRITSVENDLIEIKTNQKNMMRTLDKIDRKLDEK